VSLGQPKISHLAHFSKHLRGIIFR